MDNNIKKWLEHFNSSNKKRKLDEDDLIKELKYSAIIVIIKLVKENNVKNSKLELFFEGLKIIFSNINKKYNTNTTKSLTIRAINSISMQIIIELLEVYHKTPKFNLLNYLSEKKEEYYIPEKKRHIEDIEIDDNEDDDDDDDYMIDSDENEIIIPDDNSRKFLLEVKKLSKENNSTADIIDYFSDLNENDKNNAINELNSIIKESAEKIPFLFKILKMSTNMDTKKVLLNKIFRANDTSGKSSKWIEDAMKIPFGCYKGLELSSIKPKEISSFLNNLINLMDKAVYGHENAKKQIVNIIAQTIRNPSSQGSVIGLYGIPGNGKTSIIKEGIAKAMNKPFVFISLGGAQDSSFLDGHSYTYEGSIYGRIAQALIDSKCMNPIIYFDELDKVSEGHKGDEIINLLIHLIDPVQNKLFRDKYFYDLDLDLSKVTFIFSFNDPSKINYILRDRITLIETKFLTNEMKIHITNNYLLKDICKDVGINEKDIKLSDDITLDIINNYTNEGGVRRLKEHLYFIIRELNKCNLTKTKIVNQKIDFPMTISKNIYNELFKSRPKYIHLNVHKNDGIGMVNGLWANSLGQGGVLPIESTLIPTKELMTVKATGSLGEVIKESIDVALSVAWNKLDENTKNIWMTKWTKTPECFHIHCPDGSTGKEGPSAGAAMTLTFYSRLINKKVNHLVAMTGEINLREEVTEIGGLDEKLNAAKRAGASTALVPYNNKIDLENVIKNNPKLIDDKFKVILVSNFDEVIANALIQ
uniref:Lon proteolytic domain-containing protein n=1 Tax=viral metagenome TaxID=1070528 RepID=A0A6C0HXZ9_9ZZZZ